MSTATLFTDKEFLSILSERYGKSWQRIHAVVIAWGKLEPEYHRTQKGFGRRKMWTTGQLTDAKRYLDKKYSAPDAE
jgi:hypothetical protein